MNHTPVLLKEVLEILNPQPGEFFVDGTVNGGGHALAILERGGKKSKFLGIDLDKTAIQRFRERIAQISYFQFPISKLNLVNDNYKNMKSILEKHKLPRANGILLDLGFSSNQLLESGRGFSFQNTSADGEPLLMTYSETAKPAYQWLEDLKEKELASQIEKLSGERWAEKIAKAIKKNLPIKTTGKLVSIIQTVLPRSYEHGRIHPATRTFQALRILVNQELANLTDFLSDSLNILAPGGRLAIISFHSLEDRIVKDYFKRFVASGSAEFIHQKPIVASREEVRNNPRSRSAKLRAIRIKI